MATALLPTPSVADLIRLAYTHGQHAQIGMVHMVGDPAQRLAGIEHHRFVCVARLIWETVRTLEQRIAVFQGLA